MRHPSDRPHRPARGAAALALAAGLVASGCGGRPAAKERAPESQAITLAPENVAVVAARTLRTGPEISGTLRAKREAAIRAEIGGTLLEALAEAGQRVREGQLLARIDDAALQQGLLAARSGVSAARNALQVAEANAARARTLAEAGAMAAQQAEQAEAALEGARAQLADARARLSVAEQQAGKARVRAPFAGVVAQRQASAGDVVAPGAALFSVIDPARLQFEGSVPAARLGEVKPGAPVEFTVTGFEGQRFGGEIERVAPAVDPVTGQVRVYVDVRNDRGGLLSGLYAQGRVASASASALAAPLDAVDASTSPPTVMRVAGGKAEKVTVKLGLRDDAAGQVAITSGVGEGDVLVLGSARATLAEGAPVRLAQEPGARAAESGTH
ncbi:MAG TPA: efflux RND transporter periplasmic adaptor subunit [Anaeromyxobacter sp.]|nr:efflux RND transporter periplasmic adaptor subunit [Anaeromyxobacter sp.]